MLTLDETNIDFGQGLVSISMMWYAVIFSVLFVSLSAVFIIIDRKKRARVKPRKRRKLHLQNNLFDENQKIKGSNEYLV